MFKLILEDFKWYSGNSLSHSYLAVLINPCFYALLLYRLSNFFYKNRLQFIAKIIWLINRFFNNVDIDYRASIGRRFMIIHGLGIVIGHEVKIGEEVKIYQGVTLGGNNGKKSTVNGITFTQPIIKNNVVISPNSMILGPVIIEENSIIGANAVITKSVEANKVVYSKVDIVVKEK